MAARAGSQVSSRKRRRQCCEGDGEWETLGLVSAAGSLSAALFRFSRHCRLPAHFRIFAISTANGLASASHDILRLYDLRDVAFKHATVPFLIIPGPPRPGVISQLYVDPSSRFLISAAGTRGWEGSSTEVLIGYEIGVVGD
jgi:hypothetical protein